jgi:hypothetical protein
VNPDPLTRLETVWSSQHNPRSSVVAAAAAQHILKSCEKGAGVVCEKRPLSGPKREEKGETRGKKIKRQKKVS